MNAHERIGYRTGCIDRLFLDGNMSIGTWQKIRRKFEKERETYGFIDIEANKGVYHLARERGYSAPGYQRAQVMWEETRE